MRRNMRTCFQCGKPGHFVADCQEKVKNKDGYKHKLRTDGKYRSRCDHKTKHKNKHKDERRSRKKGESRLGPSYGWSERRRLQFCLLHLELKQK
jgi:hypothetical protein